MNACEMFNDPCKSANGTKLRMLENTVANLTNLWRMKREHEALVTNLQNTHCGCFSFRENDMIGQGKI